MSVTKARGSNRLVAAILLSWMAGIGAESHGAELARGGSEGAQGQAMQISSGQELRISQCKWAKIVINGKTFEEDVVIDRGVVRERKKKPSKKYQSRFGHTPVSVDEEIPWDCEELVIGIGFQSRLPVMREVMAEAARRKVKIMPLPTPKAVEYFRTHQKGRNAIFHLTC